MSAFLRFFDEQHYWTECRECQWMWPKASEGTRSRGLVEDRALIHNAEQHRPRRVDVAEALITRAVGPVRYPKATGP